MKNEQDAYGQAVWDYYNKRPAYEVTERSDGMLNPRTVDSYFAHFEDWPKVERQAMRYARGRVLDVGCGPGGVALYLQNQRELDVLGIDLSPLAVKVCKLRGLRKARTLAFEELDFRKGSFESVVMFGTNFGLLGSRAKGKRLLKKLYTMTSPRATLLGESVDPYKTDDPDHLGYQEQNRAKGRMSGQVRMRVRYKAYVGPWFDYLLVSPDEMRELASEVGWRVHRVIRSDDGPLYVGILRKVKPGPF